MASVDERRAALEAAYPAWEPMTLAQALDAAAERYPDRPFLLSDERSVSYAEVRNWSRRLAAGLIASCGSPGDHVALVMANYLEFVALKFAIARAGAIAVPINFMLRAHERAYVLGQSDATLLVTMDRFRTLDYLAALDELAPDWEHEGGGTAFPRLRQVVVFSGEGRGRDGVVSLEELERRDDVAARGAGPAPSRR